MFLYNPTILGKQQKLEGDDMFWFVKVNVFIGLPNAISFMLKQSECERSCWGAGTMRRKWNIFQQWMTN